MSNKNVSSNSNNTYYTDVDNNSYIRGNDNRDDSFTERQYDENNNKIAKHDDNEITVNIFRFKFTDDFTVELYDSNKLTINGTVNSLTGKITGFSKLQTFDLQAVNAIIEAKDNAEAEINVKQKMDVKTKGSAQIRYRGEPSENRLIRNGGTIEKE